MKRETPEGTCPNLYIWLYFVVIFGYFTRVLNKCFGVIFDVFLSLAAFFMCCVVPKRAVFQRWTLLCWPDGRLSTDWRSSMQHIAAHQHDLPQSTDEFKEDGKYYATCSSLSTKGSVRTLRGLDGYIFILNKYQYILCGGPLRLKVWLWRIVWKICSSDDKANISSKCSSRHLNDIWVCSTKPRASILGARSGPELCKASID